MPQYQGVWTLEQQAQAQSNQQWVTDPNFKNTTLLLQADGTGSGSQNQTFLDGSTNNFFITRNGNTTQGSFSPFSQAPGYWSNYFDGADDDLSIASNVNLTPAAGDFTLECWIFPTSWASAGSYRAIMAGPVSGCMFFGQLASGFGLRALAVADVVFTTTLPPTNTWTHVAVSRSGTTARLFINGDLVSTATNSTNFVQTQVVIANSSVAGTEEYSGYISNLRFIKGTAIYTSSFTPSTAPLTAVTNTQLLTCQTNRFVDNSTNAFSLSVGGTPSVQAFGPFAPALQWTPDVVGGSGYFDGSDYLATTTTAVASGSTALQLEGWVYPTAITGSSTIFGGISNGIELQYDTTNISFNKAGVSSILIPSTPPIKNAWNHILACRNTSGVVSIYLNGVRQATATGNTTTFSATTANIGGTSYVTGYLAGVRYINGSNIVDPTQTSFTLPTAPVTAVTNTVNLLNYTNAGIYDGKMANNLETVGNAQVATSPVKFGSGSMYFGSGNFLKGVASQNYVFGTGDFTVEVWLYPTSFPSALNYVLGMRPNGGGSPYPLLILTNTGLPQWGDGVSFRITGSAISLNTWTHLVVCRANSQTRMFLNGVQTGSNYADTNNYGCSQFIIGASDYNSSGENYYGFMDDFRITKGVARYFANFTPPQQALPRQ